MFRAALVACLVWSPAKGAEVASASLAVDAKSISLVGDGMVRSVVSADEGETFSTPRLSSDHQLVGWMELRTDGASYAAPVGVVVYSNSSVHNISCITGTPIDWRFTERHRIVLDCAFPHGRSDRWAELSDIKTGRVMGRVMLRGDGSARSGSPAWAKGGFAP